MTKTTQHLFMMALLVLTPSAKADIQQSMLSCTTLTDNTLRLACYDKLGASLKTATVRESSAVIAPAAIPTAAVIEADFGKPKVSPSDAIDALSGTVKTVSSTHAKRLIITLENAQVWRQTDNSVFDVAAGDAVTIEKASFGSFLLRKAGSNRTIRVKREE